MIRRKRRASHSNHERWLVSYADFITLLFAFFVVLYASSQVDKRRVGRLALAIQVAFQEMGVFEASTTQVPLDVTDPMPFSTAQAIENTERTASLGRIVSHPNGPLGSRVENGDLSKLQTELASALGEEIQRGEIAMHREPDGLIISLREVGFFESGSAQMKAEAQAAFDRIAAMLRKGDYRLRIEGHTDNAPIHTAQFPSNWELSTSRATEIVRLLIVRDGFAPDRLSASGYAEYHPVVSNRTAEGRGMNRRVDIVILGHALAEAPVAQTAPQLENTTTTGAAKPSPTAILKPTAATGALQ
ncbi:MAG: OmpA family protein [Terriglobales bacterium]|jgi:chemotaxis protein MotB